MSSALILFAHGARDPRWAAPFEALQQRLQQLRPGLPVKLAFLELMSPPLAEVTHELVAAGIQVITVVPVFLGQGGHVRRDLPELLDQLRQQHPQVQFHLTTAVGEDAAVIEAISAFCLAQVQ